MTKHQARKGKSAVTQGLPDAIGGQDVMFAVDHGANVVRPLTRLEEFDARAAAMRRVPIGTKRTCGLPGCLVSWTEKGGRGRQRVYCGPAHREQMSQRRLALVRREAQAADLAKARAVVAQLVSGHPADES